MKQTQVPRVGETKVPTFLKFVEFFHDKKREHGVIWRGQRDATWQLEPSILRLAKQKNGVRKDSAEHRGLKSFRNADPFLPSLALKGRGDDMTWAIGQHHGLQTPLLDWTYSPYVALFFACAQLRLQVAECSWPTEIAIWSLDINNVQESHGKGQSEVVVRPVFGDDAANRRLLAQQGLFVYVWPTQCLDEAPHVVPYLHKYVIPSRLTEEILIHLHRMNVNYRTLYPDVEGAALHANLSAIMPGYEGLA